MLHACLRDGVPVGLATVVEHTPLEEATRHLPPLGSKLLVRPDQAVVGTLGSDALDASVTRDITRALQSGHNMTTSYGAHGEPTGSALAVFIEVWSPPPQMLIFGAVDFSRALVRVAKVLGFSVTVCDARPVFATQGRFPEADKVVVDWPHRHLASVASRLGPSDAICVLTHDHKFDIPALTAALATKVGYIGAMGSRRTHAARVALLRDEGVSEDHIERIFGPIGIDIGARTPEETAVAICAEIISLRAGVPAASLRDASGPIHKVAS
ncbi:MAG TPA: XdhC/CoxI family protein [Acidimicrobiales bacterium]|nr:XdhC/CoxI family protein [Acidimicrobiales bacterium]